MAENYIIFHLPMDEINYIYHLAQFDEAISRLIKVNHKSTTRSATIKLSPSEAEELRETLTIKMAELGFDQEYILNKQGKMLEKLIDRLLVP